MKNLKFMTIMMSLFLTSITFAQNSEKMIFSCMNTEYDYKVEILSNPEGNRHAAYTLNVFDNNDELVLYSDTNSFKPGNTIIFSILGLAKKPNGMNTPSSLSFRIVKTDTGLKYELDEMSFAPSILPARLLKFSCQ